MARQRLYTRPAISATVALCVAVVLLRAATGTRATPWSHSTAADSGTQFASLRQRSLGLSSATDGISDGSNVPAVVGTGSSLAALVYSNVSSTSLCIGVACTNHRPAHVGLCCFTVLTQVVAGYGLETGAEVTYTASGSSAGKNALIAGQVDYAGSDSTFSTSQYAQYPDLQMVCAWSGSSATARASTTTWY